jgi:hypothetical protein
MVVERLPWQAYLNHPSGRRGMGCPRRRWTQQFSFSLETGHDSILELTEEEDDHRNALFCVISNNPLFSTLGVFNTA